MLHRHISTQPVTITNGQQSCHRIPNDSLFPAPAHRCEGVLVGAASFVVVRKVFSRSGTAAVPNSLFIIGFGKGQPILM